MDSPASRKLIIAIDGHDVHAAKSAEMLTIRRKAQMIFQDPYSSLNPRLTIRSAVSEPLTEANPHLSKREVNERVAAVLASVGLRTGVA